MRMRVNCAWVRFRFVFTGVFVICLCAQSRVEHRLVLTWIEPGLVQGLWETFGSVYQIHFGHGDALSKSSVKSSKNQTVVYIQWWRLQTNTWTCMIIFSIKCFDSFGGQINNQHTSRLQKRRTAIKYPEKLSIPFQETDSWQFRNYVSLYYLSEWRK